MEKPIIIHYDDTVGAIFMGKNEKASLRIEYIDVKDHYIRECIVDGLVEIVFVPFEKNDADILRMLEETHREHSTRSIKENKTI